MKQNVFLRIIKAIRNYFIKQPLMLGENISKTNNINNNDDIQQHTVEEINFNVNLEEKEKIRFMEIYNSVKQNQEILKELSEEDLYRIMLLLKEEIAIVNKVVEGKVNDIEEEIIEYLESKKPA